MCWKEGVRLSDDCYLVVVCGILWLQCNCTYNVPPFLCILLSYDFVPYESLQNSSTASPVIANPCFTSIRDNSELWISRLCQTYTHILFELQINSCLLTLYLYKHFPHVLNFWMCSSLRLHSTSPSFYTYSFPTSSWKLLGSFVMSCSSDVSPINTG